MIITEKSHDNEVRQGGPGWNPGSIVSEDAVEYDWRSIGQ